MTTTYFLTKVDDGPGLWLPSSALPSGPPSGAAGGDLSGTYPNPNVAKVNGTSLAGLGTGLLKNTTGTGVPSIAVGADIPNIGESQVTNLVTDLAAKVPIGNASGSIAADVTLTLAALVAIQTTASLAIGTWLITFGSHISSVAAGTGNVDISVAAGTATATFTGQTRTTTRTFASGDAHAAITFIAVVTAAGTLTFNGYASTTAATAKSQTTGQSLAGATGYTAVRIA